MKEMEEALLGGGGKGGEKTWRRSGGGGWFAEELKKVVYMAAPMMSVTVSEYLLQVISVMIVGHLGQLSLSGVAISTSFTNVTGFGFVLGMACGLETLCGQAYGAQQYQKYGTYTYCSIMSLTPICIPISLIWVFMDKLLVLVGQDPEIAMVAQRYSVFLIPALFSYPFLQSLVRYFQCQNMLFPLFLSSFAALCLHLPLCWVLVFKTSLGVSGAALSTGLSYWFNVLVLAMFMRFSPECEKSRAFVFKDIVSRTKEFFSYALPSAVMICLEWWSVEIVILLSGLLPDSKLQTSVLSICLTTISLHYLSVPYGVSAATSTRVSNALGAGNAQAAKQTVKVGMVIAAIEPILVAIALFWCRYSYGYLFSNEEQVVNYVGEMTPLLCISIVLDSLQAVLAGVARGSGWQEIGAYVNMGAYYLVGVPSGALFCFALKLGGRGLWFGLLSGSVVQGSILALITAFTNWEKQASDARERMLEGQNDGS